MPVIGRLDKQVGEVLIDPVGRRNRPHDEGDAPNAPAPPRPHANEPTDEKESRDEEARPRRDDASLPVWLL